MAESIPPAKPARLNSANKTKHEEKVSDILAPVPTSRHTIQKHIPQVSGAKSLGEGLEANATTTCYNQKCESDEIMKQKRKITILLLGESGVGKSTFINAIVNYLSFESMDAANGRPICLIPVSFTTGDPQTGRPVRVTLGNDDDNENTTDPTKSATQYPKCYKFQDDNIKLNIIDTPGIADTDGVDKDDSNMQNILDFISNYREINAFCVLLKPNEMRVDVVFKYCLFQLFTHLNKSAANNIIFLYTNARSTHYMPGDSGPALISILNQIREKPPNVDIPYNENTTYYFDSESFRYLVASVPPNNIQFKPRLKSSYNESWEQSVEECQRLFNYITQLPAHKVMDTLSLNNAKQIIQLLTKPLADITKNIADNIKKCETHRLEIRGFSGTIDELSKKLYTPSVEMISVPLDRPKTVCGDDQCCERTTINDITEVTYTTECHSPCYLEYSGGNIMGNKGLLRCKAFNKYSGKDRNPNKPNKLTLAKKLSKPIGKFREILNQSELCWECGHSYEQHLHVLYDTCSKMTKVTDHAVDSRIKSVRLVADIKARQILLLDQRMAELIAENNTIVKSMSMFACFLANNALTPINDAFEDYVRHLIANEKHVIAGADTEGSVVRLEQLLQLYRDEKKLINDVIHGPSGRGVAGGSNITLEQIDDLVDKLCKLKHKGPYISDTLKLHRQVISDHHFIQNEVIYKARVDSKFSMVRLFWENKSKGC